MGEKEQVRPLAPQSIHAVSDGDDVASTLQKRKNLRRRKLLKCCGFAAAILVLVAIVIIILAFTVFRVKEPIIKMNGIFVTHLDLLNGKTPKPGTNVSLTADVSVKNPNVASFVYSNTTTSLLFHGAVVGEARGPPGRSAARRTVRMNISVDIITDRVLDSPNLLGDIGSGLLRMSSYSRVPGRVNILGLVKRHVVVKLNCTMALNISSQAIQEQKCKRKVDL